MKIEQPVWGEYGEERPNRTKAALYHPAACVRMRAYRKRGDVSKVKKTHWYWWPFILLAVLYVGFKAFDYWDSRYDRAITAVTREVLEECAAEIGAEGMIEKVTCYLRGNRASVDLENIRCQDVKYIEWIRLDPPGDRMETAQKLKELAAVLKSDYGMELEYMAIKPDTEEMVTLYTSTKLLLKTSAEEIAQELAPPEP